MLLYVMELGISSVVMGLFGLCGAFTSYVLMAARRVNYDNQTDHMRERERNLIKKNHLILPGDRAKINKLVQMAWTFLNDRFVFSHVTFWNRDLVIQRVKSTILKGLFRTLYGRFVLNILLSVLGKITPFNSGQVHQAAVGQN